MKSREKYSNYREAGFASPGAYRDAQYGLDTVAVFGVGVIVASVICFGCWFLGWL